MTVRNSEDTRIFFSGNLKVLNTRQIAITVSFGVDRFLEVQLSLEVCFFQDDFVVVCDRRTVLVYFVEDGEHKEYVYRGKMQSVKHEEAYFVTAAACGNTVAASMRIGRVFIWYMSSLLYFGGYDYNHAFQGSQQ